MKRLFIILLIILGCQQQEKVSVDVFLLQTDLKLAVKNLEVEREKMQILCCESKFSHDGIWGDNGKAYGIAQFHERTFIELQKRARLPFISWTNQEDQIKLLDWAIRNGYTKLWSCSKG